MPWRAQGKAHEAVNATGEAISLESMAVFPSEEACRRTGGKRGRGRESRHLAAAAGATITRESHKWKVFPKNGRCADHSFLLQTTTALQ